MPKWRVWCPADTIDAPTSREAAVKYIRQILRRAHYVHTMQLVDDPKRDSVLLEANDVVVLKQVAEVP
jgi:hypothetical protein